MDAAELRRQFALVDASFCFVAKTQQAAPSVRRILRVANSFGSTQLTRQHLVALAAIAPDLLILKKTPCCHAEDPYDPTVWTDEDLEVVTFPSAPHTSQRASTQRQRRFDAAVRAKATNGTVKFVSTPPQETRTTCSLEPSRTTNNVDVFLDGGSSILTLLQRMDLDTHALVHMERRPSRPGHARELTRLDICLRVRDALAHCYDITHLYSHQFEAIQAILQGHNVVLSTPTASGKSLAYNLPMLQVLLHDARATFVYLFPTKALAQDQLRVVQRVLETCQLSRQLAATFDGDTPMQARSNILRDARIFLTNPDMLHVSILPHHRQWHHVLAHLR
ncbi:hypothetical protein PsorP6_007972 [Peronosclerospora sorghi]|uniref:Uncharacterized protein n=1 Tax=Peronosclerospora sorghi TaxID=230839 RepID=A0ACC0WB96_9STRA|nr:hypothetical protein PsorP6_007972 [Peronosclerospora sorghi]